MKKSKTQMIVDYAVKKVSNEITVQPKILRNVKQTFEEQQTGMYCTMQSLIHQIEKASYDKKYRFKFKVECEKFYKVLENVCESFTGNFNGNEETDNAYTQIVAEIDKIAESIKIRINEDEENTEN